MAKERIDKNEKRKKSKSIAFRNSNGSVIYFVDSGNKPY